MIRYNAVLGFLGLLCVTLLSPSALAHKASDSFLYLDQDRSELRLDLALRDLARVLPLDSNQDQALSGAELREGRDRITRYVEAGINLSNASGACTLAGQQWGLSSHSDGPYAAAVYTVQCPNGEAPETLDYQLLFEQDPQHRGLLSVTRGGDENLAVLSPGQPSAALNGPISALGLFGTFVYEGVIHLLIGLDHILFLLVLMLPATLKRDKSGQQRGLKQRVWQLVGVVTAFTVAHSITLALAALDIVTLPIAWVETVIALSIALAALNVAWPVLGEKTWKLAFGFGLVHGFGFASVLGDLTSGLEQTALALAGFNIGVELGQIALLILVFPVLYYWGRSNHYSRAVVPAVLVATGALSLYWVAERAMAI
jgi:HupE/UreJ protein